ncbi:MAG: hypothetical protein E7435_01900 [Ruminococcaceae bacterium]|nr:hypothetical protein [Oscillospiraceae bacterium]
MFEMILALFGIGHYGVKIADEKARKKVGDARREVFDSIEKKIRVQFGESPYNPPETREQFWIMCESIGEDLRYIFGDDWRTKLNFPFIHNYKRICLENDVVRNMFIHPTQIAYQVWLSKKGKYDGAFYQGYHRRAYNGVNNAENQEFVIRICKTIEKNMQLAHPDLSLRLVVALDKPWLVRWEHIYTAIDIHGLERPW